MTSKLLFLFLSKTYDGSLSDFTKKVNLLDKKKVQNIIVQVKDQLICLRKKYNMCYMDIKPGNILYLYPGGNDDRKNIEVALGDLGSDGMTAFRCVSSETNRTYDFGGCKDDELLSDCQKYTLSLTYLILRDGYEDWRGIAMDPNANRNTVRDVQNELRSDVVTGGETMYEILWETKEDKEVTKSLKTIKIYRKLMDAVATAEILALETVHEREYMNLDEREAEMKKIRADDQEKRWDKIFSEEGIDRSVFESDMIEYIGTDASFNTAIQLIFDDYKARVHAFRESLEKRTVNQNARRESAI